MKNKRQLLVSIIAGLLAALMIFSLIASVIPRANAETSAQIKERLDALEEEKEELDAKIEELESQISDNMSEMEQIVAQKDLIDQEVFLLYQQITNINNQIADYGLLIADKQDELDAAEQHLAELQAKNKERIRTMEKNGSVSYWSVIFKANSFVDLLDRLKMIEEIAQADKDRLEEMRVAAEAVAAAKESLETEKAALEESKAELNVLQAELEVKREEANRLLAELNAKGEEYEALLEESEAEQDELAKKIAETEDDYEEAKDREWAAAHPYVPPTTNGSTAPPSSSGWIVPCRYTAFTSPFGYRYHPIGGDWRMHNGVDLAGPTGTPIYASRSGTVSAATYNGSAGYYVQINHGDGFRSIYMHMTHYIVSSGQYVNQGQVIGYMGSTGGSTGPHLHFGISYNGSYVNPANYISI